MSDSLLRGIGLCHAVRDRNRHHGSAAFTGFYSHVPSAHHFQPLPDVAKRNTRIFCFIGVKTPAVVHNDDLAAGIRFPRLDKYVKGLGIGIPAVLDGVFHDRLQGQRRDAEEGVQRTFTKRTEKTPSARAIK